MEKINGSMENLPGSVFAVLSARVGGRRSLWELSEDGAQPCGVVTPQLCPPWVFCPCHLVQPHGDRVWSLVRVQDYEQQGCSDRLS